MAYLVLAAAALALIGWILLRRKTPGADAPAPAAAEIEAERPFGEDIANPDARVIPDALTGLWGSPGESAETALVIGPSSIREGAREEQVIAVRFIGPEAGLETTHNIAVVSQVAGGRYSLHMMGLSAAGELVDLENMDMALVRI
ncbi:hypothetical protein [Sphingomonas sp. G-3-2-10]|uniref:hypothetical protein n=1 Tax=Sphingomonas sp. G-3-2-10 TaxID=2728838 RepID=UPI00146A140A|nr:hypothetical protein [Sphingomonas sp. G-3-2-10]NML05192.1 hypothetical protein [Sphingomonas sp. G-3-2-10]